jgi:hypothetical protein
MRSFILLIFIFGKCYSRDVKDLYSFKIDSIKLHSFTSKKVIIYKYHDISILFDFNEFKQEFVRLSNRDYNISIVKAALTKINNEISKGDTAHFDQATFDKINWIPLETFLCTQMTEGKCLITDSNNRTHHLIIRVYGIMKNDRYIIWTGWRFYLPQISKWFLECTESES